ncbi:MAG: M61 family metallopeptidase [Bryobacterales bacterium]|nr:M61 family metallopeptidase [Acidobacteriota bacterium]MCB9384057.1 M61 family metallopeptidase [Bryobacterales bacterium]
MPFRALSLLVALAAPLLAMPPIRYTVRFPAPQTQTFEVEAVFPVAGMDEATLMMAVWTPGSYLLREYSGKIERMGGPSGEPVEKVAKNRWRVVTKGADEIRIVYRLYAREMSVRTNWVEKDFAILIGAGTFLTLVDPATGRPAETEHRVQLEPPSNWPRSASGMRSGEAAHSFIAQDFDELVDSPILVGDLAVYPYQVDGKPHELVNLGEGGVFDGARAAADSETLTRAQVAFWGAAPYPRYSMLNAITESGGGLEHKNSALLMSRRFATSTRKDYVRWLKLFSHEFFHAWNGKRLRPAELGPFDYEHENYTTGLWVVEGLTSYYESVLLARASLIDEATLLEQLSEDIENLQGTPGRDVDTTAAASFDAWVKLYRRDEGSPNRSVSYYVKGAVVGMLLDAEIRSATNGKRSLDDVLRAAFTRYAGETGYTSDEFRSLISEIAGVDLAPWLERALDQPGELDYSVFLTWFGLRFTPPKPEGDEPAAWIGAKTAVREGRLFVTEVRRGTPAFDAGLNVDDEILAIDGFRVAPSALDDRLSRYRPGATLEVLISRREKLETLAIPATAKPRESWKLEVDPAAPEMTKARRAAWLQ